jgi:hypothetical protein
MSYTYNSFNNRPASKWDTIQSDIADQYIYLDEVEVEVDPSEEDIFGFANAIQIDHLSDKQVDELLAMFDN